MPSQLVIDTNVFNLWVKGWGVSLNDGSTGLPPTDYGCSTSVDPSGRTSLLGAWDGCNILTSFPTLDVSSCEVFANTWRNCTSLTSFPVLDVSQGINFNSAWNNCQSLTAFPQLDVSQGINFNSAWNNCQSLTAFPQLDVSQGTNFGGAWFGCDSLTSFPLLDVSQGTGFSGAWVNCTSLTTFPAGMFDSCSAIDFSYAWENCALSQQSVNNILVSLDTAGQSNGYVSINGGTSSAPGVAGLAAKVALQGKGWTVLTN